jgi:hypothetical protein
MTNNHPSFAVCLLAGMIVVGWAQDEKGESKEPRDSALAIENRIEVPANASEITRLRIERRNAAVENVIANHALYLGGKGSFDAYAKAALRALDAELDTPGSNRRQILEQHVAIARELESATLVRYNSGVADFTTKTLATYLRLDMELRLARWKEEN